MSYFSERIKHLRRENNLSQKVVASAIGISQGNYSGLENGKFDPSLETLINIAEYYDMSIDELVTPFRIVYEVSDSAKSIAKQYDMLPVSDQIEIQKIFEIKMKKNHFSESD